MDRIETGSLNYHSGLAAEAQVAEHFLRNGREIMARRWRGPGGEIDLVVGDGERVVFVEVKKARDHDRALARVSARQLARIQKSAEAFASRLPNGALTDMRIDIALVDAAGRIQVIENATMH